MLTYWLLLVNYVDHHIQQTFFILLFFSKFNYSLHKKIKEKENYIRKNGKKHWRTEVSFEVAVSKSKKLTWWI